VLDIEKIQGESVQAPSFEPVDLQEIVEGAVHGMEQLFAEKNVACSVSLSEGSFVITGNRDRLIQVVINLLSNALKFAPLNTGWVEVSLATAGGGVLLRVRDNGPGIPEEKQALVFEKFTQLSRKDTGKPQGSGLGLYITRAIVEQHGGRIRVDSKAGEGACFEVWLRK
jgi:signal transduction histidine kinase